MIERDDLRRGDLKCLFKAGVVGRPWGSPTLVLGEGPHRLSLEVEVMVGANDEIIDLRGAVVWTKEGEEILQWIAGLPLISGKPQIAHSFRKDGKWYALLIEARSVWASGWLLGE